MSSVDDSLAPDPIEQAMPAEVPRPLATVDGAPSAERESPETSRPALRAALTSTSLT